MPDTLLHPALLRAGTVAAEPSPRTLRAWFASTRCRLCPLPHPSRMHSFLRQNAGRRSTRPTGADTGRWLIGPMLMAAMVLAACELMPGFGTDERLDATADIVRERLEGPAPQPDVEEPPAPSDDAPAGPEDAPLLVEDLPLLAEDPLRTFYRTRAFAPAWVDATGLSEQGRVLVDWIERAHEDGLDPRHYRLPEIEALLREEPDSPGELARLELLLGDASLLLGTHLLHGRVDPESKEPVWAVDPDGTVMEEILNSIAGEDPAELSSALAALRPSHPSYEVLRDTLAQYSEQTGSSEGPRVAEGETPGALDAPVEDRIRSIVVSMERWRWLPRELEDSHILVNIPAFETRVVMDGERVMTLRSVVGQEYRQTPALSGTMDHLVLAPEWYVPASIAYRDHVPDIRDDPDFFEDRQMEVLDRETWQTVDPEAIDWDEVTEDDFEERWVIRQKPGPHNALGDVQFMFPNPHNVYLHDTPAPELFDEQVRDFSSGCIRVERALELAELLLKPDPQWDREAMEEVIGEGEQLEVPLPDPIPIYIQYWTAWVDEEGTIHFQDDVYERDDQVHAALEAPRPG